MAMEDGIESDMWRREELRLIKTFIGITDPRKRQRILELAEQLADEASSDAAGHGFAATDAPLAGASVGASGSACDETGC
ncbi:hypothetical protein IC761_31790 [Bradyrhizobium commune]|uniref:Uncharacterized protein n=2 Tax=Bradyrhizobium commune TaxID=83627 RepID=A0A7S9H3T4_9BRAD|nr:hypothetical protein IC761_31790 [Bradyrhizobium commune]